MSETKTNVLDIATLTELIKDFDADTRAEMIRNFMRYEHERLANESRSAVASEETKAVIEMVKGFAVPFGELMKTTAEVEKSRAELAKAKLKMLEDYVEKGKDGERKPSINLSMSL